MPCLFALILVVIVDERALLLNRTNMLARDAEEGIGAFIEKRDPNWQDS